MFEIIEVSGTGSGTEPDTGTDTDTESDADDEMLKASYACHAPSHRQNVGRLESSSVNCDATATATTCLLCQ